MSLLTKVERKSRSGRLFLAGVFLLVLLGSVTMAYPFLLMLSGSMRSSMDASEMDLVPDFLTDDAVLVRKFMETKYNYDPIAMNTYRQTRAYSFEQASVPDPVPSTRLDDFVAFAGQPDLPAHWHILGGTRLINQMESVVLQDIRARVRAHYDGNLGALNRDLGAIYRNWNQIEVLVPNWLNPRYDSEPSPVFSIYNTVLHERHVAERAIVNLTAQFLRTVVYPAHGASNVDDYNAAHARPIASYETFTISQRVPGRDQPLLRNEWLTFVRNNLHPAFIQAQVPDAQYRQYLRQRFKTPSRLKAYWRDASPETFDDVTLPSFSEWLPSPRAAVYRDFLATLSPESLAIAGPEFAWRDYLKQHYGTIEALNEAHGTAAASWRDCQMPQAELEAAYVRANTGTLRRRFATRNFRIVSSQIFVQGRPFYNTMVYVILTLVFALTVQPLAAYALSRFNPPGMWKFIFVFMATMAFPPMVGTIPTFLLMKKLHLLNTFAALVLPVTVNGYLIFLLKGFFDSIPKHLYEAAAIEGASELTMFRHITMALSKPILAVVALNAFRIAWMAFMHPLIVCPDEKMHVLAVWLHQFQQTAPTSAVFASILMASIPTLLIFIFTQGTIMKGIAVPAEK